MVPSHFGDFSELVPIVVDPQTVGPLTVRIASLDMYEHGAVLNVALSLREGTAFDLSTARGPRGPELEIEVTDKAGTIYRPRLHEGGGDDRVFRLAYLVEPELRPSERRVTITIASVSLARYLAERPNPETVERWPGPWRFEIGTRWD
jgi:hypothetical protein